MRARIESERTASMNNEFQAGEEVEYNSAVGWLPAVIVSLDPLMLKLENMEIDESYKYFFHEIRKLPKDARELIHEVDNNAFQVGEEVEYNSAVGWLPAVIVSLDPLMLKLENMKMDETHKYCFNEIRKLPKPNDKGSKESIHEVGPYDEGARKSIHEVDPYDEGARKSRHEVDNTEFQVGEEVEYNSAVGWLRAVIVSLDPLMLKLENMEIDENYKYFLDEIRKLPKSYNNGARESIDEVNNNEFHVGEEVEYNSAVGWLPAVIVSLDPLILKIASMEIDENHKYFLDEIRKLPKKVDNEEKNVDTTEGTEESEDRDETKSSSSNVTEKTEIIENKQSENQSRELEFKNKKDKDKKSNTNHSDDLEYKKEWDGDEEDEDDMSLYTLAGIAIVSVFFSRDYYNVLLSMLLE